MDTLWEKIFDHVLNDQIEKEIMLDHDISHCLYPHELSNGERKTIIKCWQCEITLVDYIKKRIDTMDHPNKIKGRDSRTLMQWLLSKCCDEDVEVKPEIITYDEWSRYKKWLNYAPSGVYNILLLYGGEDFDLVTYGSKKMYRFVAKFFWEKFDENKRESESLLEEYKNRFTRHAEFVRKLSFQTKSYDPYTGPYNVNSVGMYGNANSSDPAACYRSDDILSDCISQIRNQIHSNGSERKYPVYISASLTRSYYLSKIEAEELIRWVKNGKYTGEFIPNIG